MQNKLASGARLGRQALLFPLCLVLYEFSTYIGNDMIQPGMGNDSNLLIVFYVQIMPDDFVMQLH
ncbi:hypothetical protein P2R60_21105, partial [Escherichia coli]